MTLLYFDEEYTHTLCVCEYAVNYKNNNKILQSIIISVIADIIKNH